MPRSCLRSPGADAAAADARLNPAAAAASCAGPPPPPPNVLIKLGSNSVPVRGRSPPPPRSRSRSLMTLSSVLRAWVRLSPRRAVCRRSADVTAALRLLLHAWRGERRADGEECEGSAAGNAALLARCAALLPSRLRTHRIPPLHHRRRPTPRALPFLASLRASAAPAPSATAAMAAEALPEPQSMRMESVGSHAFKKLGAVAISAYLDPAAPSLHYESAASFAAQSLPVSRSLLASSGDSGWMFLVAPGLAADPTGQSHGLLYARSAAICAAIEEDVAAQEEEAKDKGEEGPSKKSDLPLSDKLFRFMRVEVQNTSMANTR